MVAVRDLVLQRLGDRDVSGVGTRSVGPRAQSWIQQSDISPLFLTLPELRQLRVRGADGLEVGAISHDKLEHLAFESGGLPSRIVDAVVKAHLPELKHLELWLGEENYGYDGSVQQLDPIISGDCFPKLRYLGLKNSEEQDKIAKRVAKSPSLSGTIYGWTAPCGSCGSSSERSE